MDTRILASGRVAVLDESGRVVEILGQDEYHYYHSTPERTCRLCDGIGHGYPGAGPCYLEDYSYAGDRVWGV